MSGHNKKTGIRSVGKQARIPTTPTKVAGSTNIPHFGWEINTGGVTMTKVEKRQLQQVVARLKEDYSVARRIYKDRFGDKESAYQEGRMDTIREVVSKLEKIVERS